MTARTLRRLLIGVSFCLQACDQTADETPNVSLPTNEESLLEISRDTGLEIIDVSVPFERFSDAPMRLQRMADALNGGSPSLYLMRYRDDTLRETYRIFAIRESGSSYIELNSRPNDEPSREESEITDAEYDEETGTLILQTPARIIRLTPAEVTSVGA